MDNPGYIYFANCIYNSVNRDEEDLPNVEYDKAQFDNRRL